MQSVQEAIKVLENYISFSFCKEGAEAWATLKSAVLAQQTNNTGSPKLPPCEACLHYQKLNAENITEFGYCPRCGRQLRADA